MAAVRKKKKAVRRERLSASQLRRLVAFPAIRKEITGALRTTPLSVEIPRTGDFVHFRLMDPKDCVPGLYATLRVGRKGTLLRICTAKKDVKKKAQFRAFLKRMGLDPRTGKARRRITDAERKDMIYQMRAAGIIGGAKTQGVLVPKRRVEEAVRKLSRAPEVRRVIGAASNPGWYIYDTFPTRAAAKGEGDWLEKGGIAVPREEGGPGIAPVKTKIRDAGERMGRKRFELHYRITGAVKNPTGRGCPKGKVRSRKGKCVKPIGYRAKKGKLYGWHTDLPAARRRQILAMVVRKDGYAKVIQRLQWLINITHDKAVRRAATSDRTWVQNNRRAIERKRVAANPILATLGIRSNPVVQQLNVPFRHGQKITPARMRQWLQSLPNGPMKTQLTRRFNQNIAQYRRFHLGAEPKYFLAQAIALGSQKNITDVDFVTSEGKEFAATYQVPAHSGKYVAKVDGRYVHAHGESGVDITIKRPRKRKNLPERFHTPDGKFVGVVPSGNVKITDWYKG